MSEKEFFKKLFPPPYQYIKLDDVDIHIPQPFDYWDKPRTEEEGPVCEGVGENTNKALFLYFQNLFLIKLNYNSIYSFLSISYEYIDYF